MLAVTSFELLVLVALILVELDVIAGWAKNDEVVETLAELEVVVVENGVANANMLIGTAGVATAR